MHRPVDKASPDLRTLPDDDLIALLCATEDEIDAHGERIELKELLVDCTMELIRRPALLRRQLTPSGEKQEPA